MIHITSKLFIKKIFVVIKLKTKTMTQFQMIEISFDFII